MREGGKGGGERGERGEKEGEGERKRYGNIHETMPEETNK